MVESVGKKLNQARLKRGLTIDEAAHATKLRPDKIAALEADDYSRFANNIYAKGFLQIYARFLNVDVSEFARTLDNANPISVSDYQYLSNAPMPRRDISSTQVQRDERRAPSIAPLLFFAVILAIGLGGTWIYMKSQQLSSGEKTVKTTQPSEETPTAPVATPTPVHVAPAPVAATPAPQPQLLPQPQQQPPAPAPVATTTTTAPIQQVRPVPTPLVAPRSGQPLTFTPVATPSPVATPGVARTEPVRNSDLDFVRPTPVQPSNEPSAQLSHPTGVNEVQVAAIRTTYITVRKDDPKSSPIFEGQLYSSANPLKLKGARFFIDARDPNAVQITKNGLPYAYQAPNIPVQ